MSLRKKILLTTALAGLVTVTAQPAFAVSDAEFETLKKQMAMFAEKLESMENEQSQLEQENALLKEQNEALITQNHTLSQNTAGITYIPDDETMDMASVAQGFAEVEPASGGSGGFLVPGTDTRLKLGGYIKVDAIHDFGLSRDGNGEDFGLYSSIPLDGSDEDRKGNNTRIHARQTRLNLTATTPTEHGDLKLFVEGDFYGDQGSETTTNAADFALRHAYGKLGPVLIGQTWSNYMDLKAYPESLDFQGVSGNTLLRQGQIRYTHRPDGSQNEYSIAIENPNSEFIGTSGLDTGIEQYPDVTAKARFVGDFGEVSLKGVGRKLEVFDDAGLNTDDEFGYAVAASGKLKVGEKDDIRFQAGYGDGIGRYIFDLAATSQAAGFDSATDRFEAIEAWGGYAAYRHWWDDSWRSNLIAGTTQVLDNPDFLPTGTTNESIYSAHANLIWSVNDKVDVGGEYIYGHRETEDGSEGTLHRTQFSAKYKF